MFSLATAANHTREKVSDDNVVEELEWWNIFLLCCIVGETCAHIVLIIACKEYFVIMQTLANFCFLCWLLLEFLSWVRVFLLRAELLLEVARPISLLLKECHGELLKPLASHISKCRQHKKSNSTCTVEHFNVTWTMKGQLAHGLEVWFHCCWLLHLTAIA